MGKYGKVRCSLSVVGTVVQNRLAFESLAHERLGLGKLHRKHEHNVHSKSTQ